MICSARIIARDHVYCNLFTSTLYYIKIKMLPELFLLSFSRSNLYDLAKFTDCMNIHACTCARTQTHAKTRTSEMTCILHLRLSTSAILQFQNDLQWSHHCERSRILYFVLHLHCTANLTFARIIFTFFKHSVEETYMTLLDSQTA